MQSFIKDFPNFAHFFNFQQFNEVQLKCYKPIMKDKRNIVVSAPTSSGKTVIFQLAIINEINHDKLKGLYLAPIKSLCHEKFSSWETKFKHKIKVFELTSDTTVEQENANQLEEIDMVIATPEKIDAYSRKSLSFLSKINLLLVDEVHMLNFEERGATLEAVVSRIMSINNPRIIAVSATIPNIKQVAQWLRVPNDMTFLFNEDFRPVKIKKVVLGFKSSNNPYTFQKMLSYKLVDVIRTYSENKGVLVFCQTQKGTQSACQQIISDMKERQFIDCDQTLVTLIQNSKRVANTSLQIMMPQGVAFHNASLSHQDRSIVQKLFLDNKLRILCTTSTLAMGINLPARLVVIKSTQCYRGAGKGYQQYTQIQIDQMMGRAGRPPFDTEGTVVIMTQKQNYNKYLNSGKLEILQSHLFEQLCEHINAEISLQSIKSFGDTVTYFKNSFCYIRMKNSPNSYGIKGNLELHVERVCLQSVNKLKTYDLIQYYPQNLKIVPKLLGINVARNSIQIETIINIVKDLSKIKSERDFLSLLCDSEEMKKYRNKLDQRKLLKQINDHNKYSVKNAISTAEKKCYVLLQCQLDGRNIQNWQLRKQAKDIVYFMRRLVFCVKTAANQHRLFWPFYWSNKFIKIFSLKFWERNQQMGIRQFEELNEKWRTLSVRGFKNIDHVMNNLHQLDTICQKNSQFSKNIANKVQNLKEGIILQLAKCNQSWKNQWNNQSKQNKNKFLNGNDDQFSEDMTDDLCTVKGVPNSKDTLIVIKFGGFFDEKFKSILIIVGQSYELYTIRTLKQDCKETTVAINSSKKYNIAIIKSNYIGFDQFYQIQHGRQIKKIENVAAFIDIESDDKLNKVKKEKNRNKSEEEKSLKQNIQKYEDNLESASKSSAEVNKKVKKNERNSKSHDIIPSNLNNFWSDTQDSSTIQNRKSIKSRVSFKNTNISRKKPAQEYQNIEDDFTKLNVKPGSHIPLNQYKCWKPGFRPFKQEDNQQTRKTIHKQLMVVEEASSKSKSIKEINSLPTVKSKNSTIQWQKFIYNHQNNIENKKPNLQNLPAKNQAKKQIQEPQNSDPYDYFLNLFTK